MSVRLNWTERSLDDLGKLDVRTRTRVLRAVERLAETGQGDVRRLLGDQPEWRLRVGDWRVRFLFSTDSESLTVLRVLPRGRAYRR